MGRTATGCACPHSRGSRAFGPIAHGARQTTARPLVATSRCVPTPGSKPAFALARACLAIPPELFPTVIDQVGDVGLAERGRVVVEKPFGRDLESSRTLNQVLHRVFPEEHGFASITTSVSPGPFHPFGVMAHPRSARRFDSGDAGNERKVSEITSRSTSRLDERAGGLRGRDRAHCARRLR